MPQVDVLVPTYRRPLGLAVTLASLYSQTLRDFAVTISDQTPEAEAYLERPEIRTLMAALSWRDVPVTVHRHLPARGLAEHRQFLLEQARADYVHFVDDDVLLDPPVLERMLGVIRAEGCGFVGCAATGLSYLEDERPHQQHLERRLLAPGEVLRYKVAWVGGANVLYDRAKLLDVGGFSFWRDLPPEHAGEEAVVQFLLVHRYGGCGLLPSGTYHLELETNVPDRSVNATELFPRLLERLESGAGRKGVA